MLEKLRTRASVAVENLRFFMALAKLRWRNLLLRGTVLDPAGPVVSLTTYGARLRSVFLTIESIAEGHQRPSRLILWIDEQPVFERPPAPLRRLQRRGLEIRLCENLGPHKKYLPYVEGESRFQHPLATADDDVLYPRHWLQDLLAAYRHDPRVIHCFRAREIKLHEGALARYIDWPLCTASIASFAYFAVGVSGIIYPPAFLERLKAAGRAFAEVCPRADDIWLHANAVRHGFEIRQLSNRSRVFPEIPGTQSSGLYHSNQFGSGNDAQVARTYTPADIDVIRSGLAKISTARS